MIKNLDTKESIRILKDNCIGRLAFISQGHPYVVPITYYYDQTNNTVISYSGAGHKVNAMRMNDSVSMEVDEIESLNNWKAIMVHGKYEELSGADAKYLLHEFSKGVKNILSKKGKEKPEFISEFSSKIYSEEIPVVYRIKILEITGKKRD